MSIIERKKGNKCGARQGWVRKFFSSYGARWDWTKTKPCGVL